MDSKKKFYKNILFWVILALIVIAIIVIWQLPFLAKLYFKLFSTFKVNPTMINLSRLELLKICLSLIGPVLTFLVFRNTVNIQNEAREDRKKDKQEAENRRNLDDANREFYSLLDLFKRQQADNGTKKNISFLYRSICDNENSSFINNYNVRNGNLFDFSITLSPDKESTLAAETNKFYLQSRKMSNEEVANFILFLQYDNTYNETTSYFKVFHRILKNLNKRLDEKALSDSEYSNYIGILRTQLSSEELVVLLVNSLYIKKGLGLGIELMGSDVFGDEKDFEVNQHFNIPIPKIKSNDILIFVKNNKNIEERKKYQYRLENITDIDEFNRIINFKSFIEKN